MSCPSDQGRIITHWCDERVYIVSGAILWSNCAGVSLTINTSQDRQAVLIPNIQGHPLKPMIPKFRPISRYHCHRILENVRKGASGGPIIPWLNLLHADSDVGLDRVLQYDVISPQALFHLITGWLYPVADSLRLATSHSNQFELSF